MIVCSLARAMGLSACVLRGRDFATLQRGGGGLARRPLGRGGDARAGFIVLVLLLVLSPHIGILLLSIATVWSLRGAARRLHARALRAVFRDSARMIGNTLLYCGLAGLHRRRARRRDRLPGAAHEAARAAGWLDWSAMSAVAIPGLVLGIGLLRTYYDVELPFAGEPLATFWFMMVIAYAVRRLPYALRSLRRRAAAASRHPGGSGARTSAPASMPHAARIVVPLMTGGILAGFVTSFATAAVELSATLLLVTRDATRRCPTASTSTCSPSPAADPARRSA